MTRLRSLLLMAPSLLTIGIFMAVPMLVALAYSFMTSSPYGGVQMPFSVGAYIQILYDEDFDGTLAFTTDYLMIIGRSVVLAGLTTAACLAVAFPTAWFIVCRAPRQRQLLLFLVSLPFWINTLIRTYCWVLLLRDEGLVNHLLEGAGVTDEPVTLLYNDGAILLGLIYTFLPFMVLPIYSTLERVDHRLIEAAYDLYANRRLVFRRILWPLARPGVAAGALLVFAPALGSFLAPDLLGGGRKLLIGSLIQLEFTSGRNWPFGSAIAVLVSTGVLIAMLIQARRGRPPSELHA
jgi:spermidine/putrescine transport system permease protein